jgi:hypothetical protein
MPFLFKNMYYIYHIPNYKHKSGRVGKIGVTEHLRKRANAYCGKHSLEVLETHTDIHTVSKREIELQKQYGYPIDCKPYSQSSQVTKNPKVADKISKSQKGILRGPQSEEHIKKRSNAHVGTTRSDETKLRMSKAQTGKTRSDESKYKNKESADKYSVVQYSKQGEFISEFESINEAQRQTGVPKGNIGQCCKGSRNTAGGFIWKYKQ